MAGRSARSVSWTARARCGCVRTWTAATASYAGWWTPRNAATRICPPPTSSSCSGSTPTSRSPAAPTRRRRTSGPATPRSTGSTGRRPAPSSSTRRSRPTLCSRRSVGRSGNGCEDAVPRDVRAVELIGAPGSGKSSIAAALGGLPGVVVLKDHLAADLPVLAWSTAAAGRLLLTRPPHGVPRSRWVAWLGRSRAAPAMVRRRLAAGAGVVVLDQGPAYTLGRMGGTAVGNPAVARWSRARVAECRRLLDAVILLDGDTAVLAERIRSRAKPHRAETLTADMAVAYLERERATIRTIGETLAAAGVPIVHLDAARPLAENIAAAMALLGDRA
ncbi:MAG: AAA family ATPase [Propionibacteriales bacterium]|nr:AAA family ATPase [Propionibacteriales bacterium]